MTTLMDVAERLGELHLKHMDISFHDSTLPASPAIKEAGNA
jgi:hypothetical protein